MEILVWTVLSFKLSQSIFTGKTESISHPLIFSLRWWIKNCVFVFSMRQRCFLAI